ncbi:MAG: F0F1 ATP synthase subunit B [Anaerolineae bacterium]
MEALGIDPALLISQIVNFLLLLLVLRFILYKPILNMLQERREKIKENLRYAEQVKEEAAAEREKHQKELEEARRQADEAIAQASKVSEEERKTILAEAKREAERVLSRAREEGELERKRILEEVRGQVALLAIAAAKRIIGEALDEERQRRLVNEFFTGISAGRVQIIDEAELAVGDTKAQVTSALPLSEEEKAVLLTNLAAQLGAEPEMEFDVDPAILGGLVLKVGDRVIDGSVAGKLGTLRQRLA